MKRFLLPFIAFATMAANIDAQPSDMASGGHKFQAFNHLDLTINAGTTGLGVELGTPIGEMFRLRTGFSFMPHINKTLHFGVQVGQRGEGQTQAEYEKQSHSRFTQLSEMLEQFTGYKVDEQVDMEAKPTYYNFHLLADFYPLPRNKHWRITAGVFIGNKQIGRSINSAYDMPSLLAVGIYNNLYRHVMADEGISVGNVAINLPDEAASRMKRWGSMAYNIGEYTHDIVYDEDEYGVDEIGAWHPDVINPETGELGFMSEDGVPYVIHHKGDVKHKAGDPYRMVPDADSMVKAWAYVNRFKPYVGIGYDGRLLKNNDRWHIGFDAGVMFWGGSPDIVTHDGTSLTKDLCNVRGQVGDYVDFAKKFEVFPVLNLRITRRLF